MHGHWYSRQRKGNLNQPILSVMIERLGPCWWSSSFHWSSSSSYCDEAHFLDRFRRKNSPKFEGEDNQGGLGGLSFHLISGYIWKFSFCFRLEMFWTSGTPHPGLANCRLRKLVLISQILIASRWWLRKSRSPRLLPQSYLNWMRRSGH